MKKTLIMQLAKVMAKFEEIKTDKAVLTADGEIEVGVEVYVEGEDGEYIAAEDGEYEAEDKIIVVADGKVAEIREKEKDEDAPVDEPVEIEEEMSAVNPIKERFDAVKQKYEASYQEIQANIYAALDAAGVWGYLVENGDDYAIVSVWEEDDKEHLYRYSISIAEDGSVTLGEREEVKVEYVPEGEEAKEEAPAEEEFDKDARIAELEAKLAAMQKPVEEPVNIKASAQEEDKSRYNRALKYFK